MRRLSAAAGPSTRCGGYPGQGHLSGCCPLRPVALRQGERPAVGLPDAARAAPLGRPRLGAAVSHRVGAVGALRRATSAAPQDPDGLGAPTAPGATSLAARRQPQADRGDRRRGRQHLRRHRAPGGLPLLGAAGDGHHAVAADPATGWRSATIADWYGQGEREVELSSAAAVWYHSGLPPVPLRWVLIRDPQGRFAPRALLCTDQDAAPEQILAWFVRRWPMEVTQEEARRHLGVE